MTDAMVGACTHCGTPGATLTITNGFRAPSLHEHYCNPKCYRDRLRESADNLTTPDGWHECAHCEGRGICTDVVGVGYRSCHVCHGCRYIEDAA